jgi:hypothetical protein
MSQEQPQGEQPQGEPPQEEQPQEEQSSPRSVKTWVQGIAASLGTAALTGAGVDSATDILPYADPQQWIVAGLVLLGLGAGQQIPSLIGR